METPATHAVIKYADTSHQEIYVCDSHVGAAMKKLGEIAVIVAEVGPGHGCKGCLDGWPT